MVRQLEIRVRCDLCSRTATRTDVRVGIGGFGGNVKPGTFDLCEEHFQHYVQPALDLLAARKFRGRRQRDRNPGRKVGPFLCLAGCFAAPLKHRSTLTVHLRRVHGMELDEYIERYGELKPLTPGELVALDVEVKCEQPGCGQAYSLSRGNRYPQQAMISHMWGHHGIKWRTGA